MTSWVEEDEDSSPWRAWEFSGTDLIEASSQWRKRVTRYPVGLRGCTGKGGGGWFARDCTTPMLFDFFGVA